MQHNCPEHSPKTNFHKGILFFFFGFVMLFGTLSLFSKNIDDQSANIIDSLRSTFYPTVAYTGPAKFAIREGGLTGPRAESGSSDSLSVSRFYPISTASGKLTIYGTGFVSGATRVYFGGASKISATPVSVTPTTISVIVPSGRNVNGYITVETGPNPESMKSVTNCNNGNLKSGEAGNGGSSDCRVDAKQSVLPTVSVTTEKVVVNTINPSDADRTAFSEYVVPGDVTGDGKFATNDLALVRAFVLNQATPTARQRVAADMYPKNNNGSFGDGVINQDDFDVLYAISKGQATFERPVVIRSFYPFVGSAGKTITISGLNLNRTSYDFNSIRVYFGGKNRIEAPSVTPVDSKTIRVVVPDASGKNINGLLTVSIDGKDYSTSVVVKNITNPQDRMSSFPEFIQTGDVNRDGVITASDVTLIKAISTGAINIKNLEDWKQLAADVFPKATESQSGLLPGDGVVKQEDADFIKAVFQGNDTF